MKNCVYLLLAFLPLLANAQRTDVNCKVMLRGHIYAQSSMDDDSALGGFGRSSNAAQAVDGATVGTENALRLFIDTSTVVAMGENYNGYQMQLVNRTDSTVALGASDSRLSVVAEAWYKGFWQAIEYLPSSGCGNSYHRVYLRSNEYWAFTIPKFSGKIATRIRYRLRQPDGTYIYSNEVAASVNKKQFTVKQGYTSSGIMDPYRD